MTAVREPRSFEVLGGTLDDAAGEAFDKGARLLGLGYPGGPAIQREAEGGDPDAFEFPVAMTRDPGLDFSFSGLKTALVYKVRELGEDGARAARADLAAGYQRAIVEQLVAKLDRALKGGEWEAVALGGGVAANAELRRRTAELCEEHGVRLKLVGLELCTDNAAMIASAARFTDPIPYPRLPRLRCLRYRPSSSTRVLTATSATRRVASSRRCGREGTPFVLVEVDIDSDDDLLRRHLERIPVVELDGEEVSALGLDEEALRARLATVSG